MVTVRYFRDLEAWHSAMDLAVLVHEVAAQFSPPHKFELGAQLRKSATSVPSNIAEGHAQRGDLVFLRHVRIALGSLAELDTQLELAVRLRIIDAATSKSIRPTLARTGQLIHGLRRSLRLSTARTVLILLGAAPGLMWF